METENRKRYGLLIGCSKYNDKRISNLKSPSFDVKFLHKTLGNPDIGNYKLVKLNNPKSQEVKTSISRFFKERKRNDVSLLYLSCHGIKSISGQLYFIFKDTDSDFLEASSVSASFIQKMMFNSFSKRQILILDCCYSGAFTKELKAKSATENILDGFDGLGSIILTSSNSSQFSFEDSQISQRQFISNKTSLFTSYIIKGLASGDADLDNKGGITADELYTYVHQSMQEDNLGNQQLPMMTQIDKAGQYIIAENINLKRTKEINENENKIKVLSESGSQKAEKNIVLLKSKLRKIFSFNLLSFIFQIGIFIVMSFLLMLL